MPTKNIYMMLKTLRHNMMSATDKDTVYKNYRQFRIWNSMMWRWANVFSDDMYYYLNHKARAYRDSSLEHFNIWRRKIDDKHGNYYRGMRTKQGYRSR